MNKIKKHYLFLLIVVIIGIVIGIIFSNIISIDDQKIVMEKISNYFNNLKEDVPINYGNNFIISCKNNIIYLIVIWILGLSIIGLLFNNFILFFKSFILGFTVGSIINVYLYSGIILSFVYIFPTILFNLLIYLIAIYYANNVSTKLFQVLFLKKEYKFRFLIRRYLKMLVVFSILLIISSLYETFITPMFIKLFSFLIK